MEEKRPNGMNVRPAPLVYHAKQLQNHVDRQNPFQYRPHENNGNPDAFNQVGKDAFSMPFPRLPSRYLRALCGRAARGTGESRLQGNLMMLAID